MLHPEIEFKSPEAIKAFQDKKLKEQLRYLKIHSPYYKRIFEQQNIDIEQIQGTEDLHKFPLTSKDQLQEFNEDFICVPRRKIIDFITSSGTLGDPVTFALTDKDLDRLAYNEAISFMCSGVSDEDVVQLMTTMDKRFMAGLAYFMGARKLGAGFVRVGAGAPELQWDTIKRIQPNVLIAVPSFILKLIDFAKANGIDFQNSSIEKIICIGEPIRQQNFEYNTLGQKITEQWNMQLFSTYASTEMSTAFAECEAGKGGHLHPELIICEFLDEQGNAVPEGQSGELVITTLGMEGMPLLRFKTGDIVEHFTEACECGRKSMRLGPVLGRRQQMIKYKGTTLYPPAIYDVLNDMKGIENYIVEVRNNEVGMDDLLIRIGLKGEAPQDLEKKMKDHFRAKLRVAPDIAFENAALIQKELFPPKARKPVVFIDKRN